MESQIVLTALGFFVLGSGLGLILGRRSAAADPRLGALEERTATLRHEVESLTKDREQAHLEVKAAREELERAETRYTSYQDDVVQHFAGTSDLVRDLTLQYRSVVSHLTDGVGQLCPEGALEIAEGMRLAALPAQSDAESGAPGEEVIETSAVEASEVPGSEEPGVDEGEKASGPAQS